MRFPLKSIVLVGLALLAAPAAEAGAQGMPLQGTFVYTAEGSDNLEQAIQQATSRMNFVTRPIARSRLKKTNSVYQKIAIGRTADEVSIAFDARAPVVSPASGSAVRWRREDGEMFDVTTTGGNGSLQQTFKAEDGERVNTFTLAPDGNTLTMNVTITSPRLPQPLTYRLRYRRQG
jgi:hypothetical protein